MPRHRFVSASTLLAVLASAAPLFADDADAAQQFRRAELAETAFGDLKGAAKLYDAAARAAGDPAMRMRAELREGACLRRLGNLDEAKLLLAPLVADEAVPDDIRRAAKDELAAASIVAPPPARAPEPGPTADRRRLAELERDLEEMRAQFDAALQRAKGLETRTEDLAGKLVQKDAEIRAMRSQVSPSSADEALRARVEEQDRRRETDRKLSRSYASFARRLHQEGQFAKARDLAYVALEKDPENVEAKALLTLVSAPLGVRERLYEAIRGVLALASEARGARTGAEIDALVAEARRRQDRDEFAPSVAPLERALALVESGASYLHDAAASRATVLSMLHAAQAHGAPRSPTPTAAPPDDPESRGLAAARELLSAAGGEVAHGLSLRFHDVGVVLAAGAAGLPPAPVGAPPEGWTISGEAVAPAPLLVECLRAADPRGFAAPGARIEAAGATVMALCDAATQTLISDRITGLGDVNAPAAELRISAYRLAPGDFAALLDRRRIRAGSTGDGVRFAVVPAADLDAIAPDLAQRATVWPSVATLRATPLRAFRMVAGTAASGLTIDLLPMTRPSGGVGVRVASEWTPSGRTDGAKLRQEAMAGATFSAGDGLVVFGLADPADPSREIAVLVRQGVAPLTTAPEPTASTGPGLSSSEMLLPAAARGIAEVGVDPIVVLGRPVPTREKALLARLSLAAGSAQTVEVKDDRVRVVGPDEARAGARRFLDQIGAVRGVQAFDVSIHEIPQSVEDHLLSDVPRFDQRPGEAFARATLRGEDRRMAERLLAGAKGRVPLLDPRVAAPPTGRADAAYVVRFAYRRDLEVVSGREPSWGRSETDLVDEGVLVAIRPFGRKGTNRVDFDVALRAAWIADRGERTRDTQLGPVTTLEPAVQTWWGDASATLGDDELLVLAKMPNPMLSGGDRTRLVVTISPAR